MADVKGNEATIQNSRQVQAYSALFPLRLELLGMD
jgi:hypothetical protein